MRLSGRTLNRTLLQRHHLLEPTSSDAATMIRHLVGLQAQENLSPYLSLGARLTGPDPYDVSRGLEDRSLVRLLSRRGTIHLLAAEDAPTLRPWTQPRMEQELRSSQTTRDARGVDRERFDDAVCDLLADGPLARRDLAAGLATRFPDVPPPALGQLARCAAPLARAPRGGPGSKPVGWSTSRSTGGSAGQGTVRKTPRRLVTNNSWQDRFPAVGDQTADPSRRGSAT